MIILSLSNTFLTINDRKKKMAKTAGETVLFEVKNKDRSVVIQKGSIDQLKTIAKSPDVRSVTTFFQQLSYNRADLNRIKQEAKDETNAKRREARAQKKAGQAGVAEDAG